MLDITDVESKGNLPQSKISELDAQRDKLLREYQKEMEKLRNLHERCDLNTETKVLIK